MGRVRKLTPGNCLYLVLYVIVFATGIFFAASKSAWVSGAGSSLIATGVAGWVLFLWVVLNETQTRRLDLLSRLGLVDAFQARAASIKQEYDDRLAGARQSIDGLGFGLRQLREDFGDDFKKWSGQAQVRILLLDPTSPVVGHSYADQRDLEEGNPIGSISGDVAAFLAQTTALRADPSGRFKVRLYSALPSINIFRVDDSLFWGPYLVKRQSRNTPTFLVRRGGTLFDTLHEHFERLWADDSLRPDRPADPLP